MCHAVDLCNNVFDVGSVFPLLSHAGGLSSISAACLSEVLFLSDQAFCGVSDVQ